MTVAPFLSVKVVALMVVGSIASLKVAVTETFLGTPVAALAGPVEVTVGKVLVGVGELLSHAAESSASVMKVATARDRVAQAPVPDACGDCS